MFDAGVRAALVASQFAAPSMVAAGRGLIVHVTAWDRDKYLGNLYYDLAKSAMNRMALGMGRELEPSGVAAVALAPGFVATERIVGMFAAAGRPAPESAETPEYVGRAVAALAGDANVLAKTGRVLTAGDLAVEYGFTDVDGRQLPPFRMPG
jgi:NAD(P)-dependent dehydrogenase (short-subunit alcohol dehydrogenase family)